MATFDFGDAQLCADVALQDFPVTSPAASLPRRSKKRAHVQQEEIEKRRKYDKAGAFVTRAHNRALCDMQEVLKNYDKDVQNIDKEHMRRIITAITKIDDDAAASAAVGDIVGDVVGVRPTIAYIAKMRVMLQSIDAARLLPVVKRKYNATGVWVGSTIKRGGSVRKFRNVDRYSKEPSAFVDKDTLNVLRGITRPSSPQQPLFPPPENIVMI